MLESVRADFLRARDRPEDAPQRAIRTFANNYGFQALMVYRLGRWLRFAKRNPAKQGFALLLWPFYWLLSAVVRKAYDIRLELSADIGPGLRIYHFGGIRLRDCRLGANCIIHQEVLIESAEDDRGGPQLSDGVWIGPHARIIGCVRIDNGATVGAGALVTKDVPARCLVLGNPARVAHFDYDNAALP